MTVSLKKKRLCVFCGSGSGNHPDYKKLAQTLGEQIAEHQWGLVYGGAHIGLMGAAADGCLSRGGEVIGVMPIQLVKLEVAHKNLTQFVPVETMHDRKQKLYDYSHAFVALPGGPGTMDEWFEILTWAQIKYHQKPIFILNAEVNGIRYYDHLLAQLDLMQNQGFFKAEQRHLYQEARSLEQLWTYLQQI